MGRGANTEQRDNVGMRQVRLQQDLAAELAKDASGGVLVRVLEVLTAVLEMQRHLHRYCGALKLRLVHSSESAFTDERLRHS